MVQPVYFAVPTVAQSVSGGGTASAAITPALTGCTAGRVLLFCIGVTGTTTVPGAPSGWGLQASAFGSTNGTRYVAIYQLSSAAAGTNTLPSFTTGGPYNYCMVELANCSPIGDDSGGLNDSTGTTFEHTESNAYDGNFYIGIIQDIATGTQAFTPLGNSIVNLTNTGNCNVQWGIQITDAQDIKWTTGGSTTASFTSLALRASALRQQSFVGTSAAANPTLAFPSAVASGSTLLAYATCNLATEPTVSTSAGTATFSTAWTRITGVATGVSTHTRALTIWYAVVNAGGTHTVLFTTATGASAFGVQEWGGMLTAPLDGVTAASASGASTAPTVTSGTTTTLYELIVACVGVRANTAVTDSTTVMSWAKDGSASSQSTVTLYVEYKVVRRTGTWAPAFTIATNDWTACVACLKVVPINALAQPNSMIRQQSVKRAAYF